MNFELTARQREIQALARRVADESVRPFAADVDLNERYPTEAYQALVASGLFGFSVSPEFGGLGLDALASVLLVEEIAQGCASAGALLLSTGGTVLPVMAYGTAQQKQDVLPAVVQGRLTLSFALTEEQAGSDASAIQTLASKTSDGWTVNGKKTWIGDAVRAGMYVLAARTVASDGDSRISSFLVPKGTAGVAVGETYSKMGARGTTHSELIFDSARLPASCLLGVEGRGMSQMMHSLDFIRLLTAAHAIGIAQAAFDSAVAHARERATFGKPLHKHQAINFLFADMATAIHAARLITVHAAAELDAGRPIGARAAMAKLHASEVATRVTHGAVQVWGARGVRRGSVPERLYRDARVTEIWDGTSEIQRLVIGRDIFGR